MTILVCTATWVETQSVLKGIRKSGLSDGFSVLKVGVGPERARANLTRDLERRKSQGDLPQLLISSGFAGAMSASLRSGMWVSAREIWDKGGSLGPFEKASGSLQEVSCYSSEQIITKEKALDFMNGRHGSWVVDMESASLARVSAEFGIPFRMMRMLSDDLNDPLPEFVSDWKKGFEQWPKVYPFLKKGFWLCKKLAQDWELYARQLKTRV